MDLLQVSLFINKQRKGKKKNSAIPFLFLLLLPFRLFIDQERDLEQVQVSYRNRKSSTIVFGTSYWIFLGTTRMFEDKL